MMKWKAGAMNKSAKTFHVKFFMLENRRGAAITLTKYENIKKVYDLGLED